MSVRVEPVGPAQFDDVVELFGPNGAVAGCWCMWWRKPNKQWNSETGQSNRDGFEALVRAGAPVGLLAYAMDGRPVGWAATAPRPAYPRLLRSNTLKLAPADDESVWSIPCFFIHRTARRTGVGTALIGGAVDYARQSGAAVLEGYPTGDDGRKRGSGELYTGTMSMFRDNDFHEHSVGGSKIVMRRDLARG